MSNTNNTTITLTTSTPITSYGSANQSVIIEINRPALETAKATNSLPTLANNIKNVNPLLTFLVYLAITVAIIAVLAVVVIAVIKLAPFGAAALGFLSALA